MTAYDVMDQVAATVEVWADSADGQPLEPILRVSVTCKGIGETDVTEWLRDVLVALAERV